LYHGSQAKPTMMVRKYNGYERVTVVEVFLEEQKEWQSISKKGGIQSTLEVLWILLKVLGERTTLFTRERVLQAK